jgi:hypothetical protein
MDATAKAMVAPATALATDEAQKKGAEAVVHVGFSTPRFWNPVSALIRWMTRSRTSHAWLLVEDPAFQLRLVLEAHTTGFRLLSFTRFVKSNKVVAIVVPDPAHPLAPALPAAGEYLGTKYDMLGLFGIFLTLVARWFVQRPWKNPFPTAGALFCSEAVICTLKDAAYPEAEHLGNETTTPAELLEWFRRQPGCTVVERDELNLWRHLKPHRRALQREGIAAVAAKIARPEAA